MSGLWSREGVPHKGWRCVGHHDLEEPSQICDMCEVQEIRYVHVMEHDAYPDTLEVGCICAVKMENDYVGPKKREQVLKSKARRKRNWLKRAWKKSNKGNDYLKTDGMHIVIYSKNNAWSARITELGTERSEHSRKSYPNQDKAKLAAFDAMIFLKGRGWGK